MYIDQYDVGRYQPKIEVVVNTNRFMAQKAPMKIEDVLLHPRVKGPTHASKAYNTWTPENA
jgi:hypothetical protein